MQDILGRRCRVLNESVVKGVKSGTGFVNYEALRSERVIVCDTRSLAETVRGGGAYLIDQGVFIETGLLVNLQQYMSPIRCALYHCACSYDICCNADLIKDLLILRIRRSLRIVRVPVLTRQLFVSDVNLIQVP